MRIAGILFVAAVVAVPTMAVTPINYTEQWDTYATGTGDSNYMARWAPLPTRYVVTNTTPFSSPNALELPANQTRGLTNDLSDGVEMAANEYIEASDLNELDVGLYLSIGTGTQRKLIDTFVEISLGDVHAPRDLTALAEPIPVLAFGRLHIDASTENVAPYFFNGQQWVATSLGVTTGYNRLWMNIRTTDVVVEEKKQGLSDTYTRAYLGGFDTVSVRTQNSTGTGTNRIDDIWLVGGNIVPEPAGLCLLALGSAGLLRRRRSRN